MVTKSAVSAREYGDGDRRSLTRDHALAGNVGLTGDVKLTGGTPDPRLELLGASLEHLTGCYRKLTPAKAAGRRQREAAAAL